MDREFDVTSPNAHTVAALERALEDDATQLGQTFRAMKETGETSPTALVHQGVGANAGAVSNNQSILRAILEGQLPASTHVMRSTSSAIRRLRRANRFDDATTGYLDRLGAALEAAAADPSTVAVEEAALVKISETLAAAAASIAGIYVYSYPHYIRYPYDEDADLRLMKVGRSIDTENRTINQTRATAAPEEAVVLRVYQDPHERDLPELEKIFHTLLDEAGHPRSRRSLRHEWFATRETFLDAIADAIGMVKFPTD